MKWFFLGALGLFGLTINLMLVADDLYAHIPALVAFNLGMAGFALLWHTAYFQQNVIGIKGTDLGLAFLCISAGIFIINSGTQAVLSTSCENFLSSRHYRIRNDVVRFIESLGYCKEFGYLVLGIGSSIMLIGTRLVLRIKRQSYV